MEIEFSAGDVNLPQCKPAVRLCRDFPGGALVASPLLLLLQPSSSILGLGEGAYGHPTPSLAPSTQPAPPGRGSGRAAHPCGAAAAPRVRAWEPAGASWGKENRDALRLPSTKRGILRVAFAFSLGHQRHAARRQRAVNSRPRQPGPDAQTPAASIPLTERPASLLCSDRPPNTPTFPPRGRRGSQCPTRPWLCSQQTLNNPREQILLQTPSSPSPARGAQHPSCRPRLREEEEGGLLRAGGLPPSPPGPAAPHAPQGTTGCQ